MTPQRAMGDRSALDPQARILVTRLRFLGDVILSLPLLRALRAAHPHGELHYLAEPGPLEVLAAQPEVDVRWPAPRGWRHTVRIAAELRTQRFGAVIDLFANPRSALLTRATQAGIRVGEDRRMRRHAYTVARHLAPGRNAIDQHLDALRALGFEPPAASRPEIVLRAAELLRGAQLWRDLGGGAGIVLHLGATQPAKEWPAAHAAGWLAAARHAFGSVVLTTSPGHPEPAARAAHAVPGTPLVPALGWREFMGFLQHARAVVTVDGAVAHAAVALGCPTVALFGPTDPAVWFPYEDFGPYRVLHGGAGCAGCAARAQPHDCMARITPDTVMATVAAVLERGNR